MRFLLGNTAGKVSDIFKMHSVFPKLVAVETTNGKQFFMHLQSVVCAWDGIVAKQMHVQAYHRHSKVAVAPGGWSPRASWECISCSRNKIASFFHSKEKKKKRQYPTLSKSRERTPLKASPSIFPPWRIIFECKIRQRIGILDFDFQAGLQIIFFLLRVYNPYALCSRKKRKCLFFVRRNNLRCPTRKRAQNYSPSFSLSLSLSDHTSLKKRIKRQRGTNYIQTFPGFRPALRHAHTKKIADLAGSEFNFPCNQGRSNIVVEREEKDPFSLSFS